MSILGNRVMRTEDARFLTSGGIYGDDLRFGDAAWIVFVRSPVAHARIIGVDLQAARRAPGVLAAFDAEELGLDPLPPAVPMVEPAMARPPMARGTVRFVGEIVAMVVASTRAQAMDAAEAVVVDLDPLPAVMDLEQALGNDVLLFPEVGSNVAFEQVAELDPGFFDGCELTAKARLVNQRVAPCPLEVRSSVSSYSAGRLTHWLSTQTPHAVRDQLAMTLGLDSAQVHVIAPDVGGGFGAKSGLYPEDLLLAWATMHLGKPVRWTETRSESMVALGHGRAQIQNVTIGGKRDGTLTHYRLEVIQDSGAYPAFGAFLPFLTRLMATGPYRIPAMEFTSTSVVTNTTPVVPYRGAGRPEATYAIERAIDIFARQAGLDPAEVRMRNLISSEEFPFTTPAGAVYDSGDYAKALERALQAAGYEKLRSEQEAHRRAGERMQMGIGISSYVEITNPFPAPEYGSVQVEPDGDVVVKSGTSVHGQGHATAWAMVAADELGVPLEKVRYIDRDTDLVPHGIGTFGSRSLQEGGVAVHRAAVQVVQRAREVAAELLEASHEDVVLDPARGVFHVAGVPAVSLTWAELSQACDRQGTPLMAEVDYQATSATFPFGSHVAVVDVDTETGQVVLRRLVAVDDAGTLINPLLVDGQVHGGLAQGIAQALLEEVVYDRDGNPLTSNLADYAIASAAELPSFERTAMETPTPVNELGAKGIGESGTIGSTPAVTNAVVDALAHLGVWNLDMPITPQRVWHAIEEGRSISTDG
ncbi:MAG: xanthine dehydrogenase family protein molybdopterin-binding subunit [Actinobacteria bacterium]|nr:xanthine dehydrogenase family protein molybdopterin-binding subunit [Actinomycetota bacterium]